MPVLNVVGEQVNFLGIASFFTSHMADDIVAASFLFIRTNFLVGLIIVVNFVIIIQKTKPTQHSVRQLRGLGLTPHILTCRSTTVSHYPFVSLLHACACAHTIFEVATLLGGLNALN